MADDVFISHSSRDKHIADAVCSILEQNRIRCWIAPRDVTPGKNYAACITEAVKTSRIMVVIFSNNSNASTAVTNELELATKHGSIIIPFRIEDVVPSDELDYYLSSRHWLDAITPPVEKHIDKLAELIRSFLGIEPKEGPGGERVRNEPIGDKTEKYAQKTGLPGKIGKKEEGAMHLPFLQKIRTAMGNFMKHPISVCIIVGYNTKSKIFAKSYTAPKRRIVFIDSNFTTDGLEWICGIGASYVRLSELSAPEVLKAMKKEGYEKKQFQYPVYLFVFTEDEVLNYDIARLLMYPPRENPMFEYRMEDVYIQYQSEGFVEQLESQCKAWNSGPNLFNEWELAARELVVKCPVYKRFDFDRNTAMLKKDELFTVLILGFGKQGRQLLEKFYCNSQFIGARFQAVLVDSRMSELEEDFRASHTSLFEENLSRADIRFVHADIGSSGFYSLLDELFFNCGSPGGRIVDYITASMGEDQLNLVTITKVKNYIQQKKPFQFPVFAAKVDCWDLLDGNSARKAGSDGKNDGIVLFGRQDELFTTDVLLNNQLDFLTCAVGHFYGGGFLNSHFHRIKNSNRAKAVFIQAFLHAMGLELEKTTHTVFDHPVITREVFLSMLDSNDLLLENLARMEHMRDNAFQIATGWRTFPVSEITDFAERRDERRKMSALLVRYDELGSVEEGLKEIAGRTKQGDEELTEAMLQNLNYRDQLKAFIKKIVDIVEEFNAQSGSGERLYIVKSGL